MYLAGPSPTGTPFSAASSSANSGHRESAISTIHAIQQSIAGVCNTLQETAQVIQQLRYQIPTDLGPIPNLPEKDPEIRLCLDDGDFMISDPDRMADTQSWIQGNSSWGENDEEFLEIQKIYYVKLKQFAHAELCCRKITELYQKKTNTLPASRELAYKKALAFRVDIAFRQGHMEPAAALAAELLVKGLTFRSVELYVAIELERKNFNNALAVLNVVKNLARFRVCMRSHARLEGVIFLCTQKLQEIEKPVSSASSSSSENSPIRGPDPVCNYFS